MRFCVHIMISCVTVFAGMVASAETVPQLQENILLLGNYSDFPILTDGKAKNVVLISNQSSPSYEIEVRSTLTEESGGLVNKFANARIVCDGDISVRSDAVFQGKKVGKDIQFKILDYTRLGARKYIQFSPQVSQCFLSFVDSKDQLKNGALSFHVRR